MDGGINGGSWSWANKAGILGDGGAESESLLLQTTNFLDGLLPLISPSGDFSGLKLKRKFWIELLAHLKGHREELIKWVDLALLLLGTNKSFKYNNLNYNF